MIFTLKPNRQKTFGSNSDTKATIIWVSTKRSQSKCSRKRSTRDIKFSEQKPTEEINYSENLSTLTLNKIWKRKDKCRKSHPNAQHKTRLNNLVFIEKLQRYQGFNPNHKHMSWPPTSSLQKRKKIFNTKYENNIIFIK